MIESDETIRRTEALALLEGLLRHNRAITADMLYVTLEYAEYTEDERMRLMGGLIRTASSYNWATKTFVGVRSTRNSSNAASLWHSNIFGRKASGKPIPESVLDREHAKWEAHGMLPLEVQNHYGLWLASRDPSDDPNALAIPHETY